MEHQSTEQRFECSSYFFPFPPCQRPQLCSIGKEWLNQSLGLQFGRKCLCLLSSLQFSMQSQDCFFNAGTNGLLQTMHECNMVKFYSMHQGKTGRGTSAKRTVFKKPILKCYQHIHLRKKCQVNDKLCNYLNSCSDRGFSHKVELSFKVFA